MITPECRNAGDNITGEYAANIPKGDWEGLVEAVNAFADAILASAPIIAQTMPVLNAIGQALPHTTEPPTRWERFCAWHRDFWLARRWG